MLRASTLALLSLVTTAAPALAQDARDGAALLARAGCGACHGADGRGTSLAPGIADPSLALPRFIASVRAARGTMPSYDAAVLSDDDIAAIRGHLVAQGARRPPGGNAQTGAERYERVGCYSCHSNQGQGVLHGPRIGPEPIRWERFAWYVRHPTGQMPPYAEVVLDETALADIYAFLESRPRPKPLTELPLLAP